MGSDIRKIYPAVSLQKTVVFPAEKAPLVFEGGEILKTIGVAIKNDRLMVLVFKSGGEESSVGVLAKIAQHWYLTPTIIGLIVEGMKRVKIARRFSDKGTDRSEVLEYYPEIGKESPETEALARHSFDQLKKLIQMEGIIPLSVLNEIQKQHLSSDRVSDIMCSALNLGYQEKIKLLETIDVKERLKLLSIKIANELQIAEAEVKIKNEVKKKMDKTQREFILREQLRAIEEELGISGEKEGFNEIEKKIKEALLPEDIEKRARKELDRLRKMPPVSAEMPYVRTYLDWLIELPWSKKNSTGLDLGKAKKILDDDHFGLKDAKERVLEHLAVQKLTNGKERGSILCFVGPPGTGKTSVGKSIAKALGRTFTRISLGGIRDEAEIRGHRRTYVGALPGRIIQAMKTAGTKNPVFMMDEIDKIGVDFRGDPSAALLEVLDPEQNNSYSDHYLEVPFDLSEVFFITTANILDPIPPALRDRMEVIDFPGYTDEEKYHIAKRFLLPKVFKSHGLGKENLWIEEDAIKAIIGKYTREAGVRNLERNFAKIARKVAKKIMEDENRKKINIGLSNLSEYLGPEEFQVTRGGRNDEVGICAALAWTPQGGEIIFIEANILPGKGNLTLTGQLGKMMQESAKAALSYVRSRSRELGFRSDFYQSSDIHVHVPSGAIKKDGPSAGIAIATSLASVLSGKKVNKDIGLTGEVTLSGKVLGIGGVKEKVLAAHRAGLKIVILPKENEKNLMEIPPEIGKQLEFKFAGHMDDVLKIALKNG